MIDIRKANQGDLDQLDSLEKHFSQEEVSAFICEGKYYLAIVDSKIVGLLRYGLFWDFVPFMNKLYFLEIYRRQGLGTNLVSFWEKDMRKKGYSRVMTSTQADEEGQHFYRKLGYIDAGGFTYPNQAIELILIKELEVEYEEKV